MSDDRQPLALAEERIRRTTEIVARQRLLVASLALAGRATASQSGLLRLYEANLALFEEALVRLREPAPVPVPDQP